MRWKAVIPISIFVLALVLFNIFFLDSIVEKGIETYGSKIAGAKVDVGSVDVKILKTSVMIRGLQIADKNDPWKNLVELENISFDYTIEPLLYKKLVIKEMSALGLRWGTERKVSGELPKSKREKEKTPSTFSKLGKKIQLPSIDTSQIKNLDWKSQIKPENLKSLKTIEEARENASSLRNDWENKINGLEIQKTLNETKKTISAAGNLKVSGIGDILKAKKTIDDLKRSQNSLKQKVQEVRSLKDSVKNDFGKVRSTLKSVKKIKDNDVGDILSNLNLPDFSAKGLSRSIFGPLWLNRLEKATFWIKTARKYMPAKKDKKEVKEEKPERRQGINVTFPGRKPLPTFLIKKIVLSGSTEKSTDDLDSIRFKGEILGITSDPALYGKPTLIDISGQKNGRRTLKGSLKGKLDHTGRVPKDEFVLSVKNIDLTDKKWDAPDYLPSTIASGRANADIQFGLNGPKMSARMNAKATKVKLSGSVPPKNQVERIIQDAFANLDDLIITATAWGSGDDLDFSVKTNLDNVISSRIKQSVGKEISQIRNQINDHVNKLVEERKGEVLKLIQKDQNNIVKNLAKKSSLLGGQDSRISSLTKKLTNQIAKQQGGTLKKYLPGGLKGIFKP